MPENHYQASPRAIILEDDVKLASAYQRVLSSMGYETTLVHKISDARICIRDQSPELILLDVELPDGNGLDLMNELGSSTRGRFIVISGDDSQRAAIKSIRNRAVELLVKPVSLEQLRRCLSATAQGLEKAQGLENVSRETAARLQDDVSYPGFWIDYGSSPALRDLRICASLSAERRRGHALVIGEPGLEKCAVAEAVHYRSRRMGDCVLVDCSNESDDTVMRNFFGETDVQSGEQCHKGYLEQASGGTLVLENVQQLSATMQSALMSFLDSGQFRPVNAAASVNVVVAVIGVVDDLSDGAGDYPEQLRADFIYRLAQVKLAVPALSQCVGDLHEIAGFLLARSTQTTDSGIRFSDQSLEMLRNRRWRGNIRQLRSTIEESLQRHETGQLLELITHSSGTTDAESVAAVGSYLGSSVWEFERQLVLGTLEHHEGDRKAAARTLGISLKTLYNRLNSYQ